MNIVKVRSLALRFTAANPRCVRAIPCEITQQKSPFTMYLYVHTDGKGISKDFRESAVEMFADYQIEFVDLQRRPLCKIVTHLSPSEKGCGKKLRELAKTIEKNLHIFENRLNVTAVQAAYKIEGSIVKDIPCVTVYVLGKGKIPAGEIDILEMTKLDGYPFDVVEGYFLPCGDPKSYVFPLQGGVGIGVENERITVGTLGAFLEDEDGKLYILSCQHVLRPNGNSDSPNQVIVQPAQLDYQNEVAKISSQVEDCADRLEKQEKKLNIIADNERHRHEKRAQKSRESLEILKNHLRIVQKFKPRAIGKYCCGLKQNETVEFRSKSSAKFYVDAAIAELDDEEVQELIEDKEEQPENSRCPLFGFKKNIDTRFIPTGKIVDVEKFDDEESEKLRFIKCGRTTGHTDGGQLETSNFYANLFGHEQKTCAGDLSDVPFKFFCSSCTQATNVNMVDFSCLEEKQFCFHCGGEIENEANTLWAYNCLAIRKRQKSFCEEGDSGALVFDDQGRAWGIIFGVFAAEGINFDFGLASPLSATLQALENRLGKKLKLWC